MPPELRHMAVALTLTLTLTLTLLLPLTLTLTLPPNPYPSPRWVCKLLEEIVVDNSEANRKLDGTHIAQTV